MTIPKKNRSEVPNADPACKLCNLPYDDLKNLHDMRFIHKIGYTEIRKTLKEKYGLNISYAKAADHFKRHIDQSRYLIKKESKKKPIAEILDNTGPLPTDFGQNEQINTAYQRLTKMTADYVNKVDKVFNKVISNPNFELDLLLELSDLEPLSRLNVLAKMHEMGREQLKDVNALRAPKVMVLRFLEETIDRALSEVNETLKQTFMLIQSDLITELRKTNYNVPEGIMSDLLRRVTNQYKERIVELRREQLSRAATTLAELEKVI